MLKGDRYICKFCRRAFAIASGYSASNLIDHLIRQHPDDVQGFNDLYLSDIIKECFDYKERSTR